eukprot:XP_001710186.1 Hypothetical protein GL50803_38412 [Giardia lamblia ATCC 50803]
MIHKASLHILIQIVDTSYVRRPITDNELAHFAVTKLYYLIGHLLSGDVSLYLSHPGKRGHWSQVDRDNNGIGGELV